MSYLDTYRRAIRDGEKSLPDDFIRKVLKFPKVGVHAQVNARFSSELLEADRRRTRMDEIKQLIEAYTDDALKLELAMSTLRQEYRMLEEKNRASAV